MSGERRRQKKNLEGLLKFCVEGTAAEDTTTNSSQFVEMDDEVYYYTVWKWNEEIFTNIKNCKNINYTVKKIEQW